MTYPSHISLPGYTHAASPLFIATAGLVLVKVLDPAAAEKIVGMLAGLVP